MSKQPLEVPRQPHRPSPRLPELNARIRVRRSQLGLTGAELAQRSGISPSYVSLIESGAKVPDEDVAADLARVLDDDEDLYVAWARASRLGPEKLLDRLNRLEASPSPKGEARTESPSVVPVPLLAEGADPGVLESGEPGRAIVDSLLLDRRLVGPAGRVLFACEVTERSMKHLRGVAEPGDVVVLQRSAELASGRICAVRRAGGLLLSRVLFNGRTLLLLPGEGESGFESIEVQDAMPIGDVVVGSHVLLIRR